jgi:hypothetical protein
VRPCLGAKTTGSPVVSSSPISCYTAAHTRLQRCPSCSSKVRARAQDSAPPSALRLHPDLALDLAPPLAPASVLPRDLILDSDPALANLHQVLVAQASALSPGHSLHRHRQAVRHPTPSLDLLQAPAMHHLPSRPASRKAGSNRLASAVLGHSPADRDHSFSSSHLSATRVLLIRVSINTSRGRNSNSNSHHSGTDQDPSPHGHQARGALDRTEDRQCPDPFEAVEAVVLRDLAGHSCQTWMGTPASEDRRTQIPI